MLVVLIAFNGYLYSIYIANLHKNENKIITREIKRQKKDLISSSFKTSLIEFSFLKVARTLALIMYLREYIFFKVFCTCISNHTLLFLSLCSARWNPANYHKYIDSFQYRHLSVKKAFISQASYYIPSPSLCFTSNDCHLHKQTDKLIKNQNGALALQMTFLFCFFTSCFYCHYTCLIIFAIINIYI